MDVVKNNIKEFTIDIGDCKLYGACRIQHYSLKRALRKEDLSSFADIIHPEHVSNICCRVCLSNTRPKIYDQDVNT